MNWADLLLPTPLGLVILGAVAVAQNGVNDFRKLRSSNSY